MQIVFDRIMHNRRRHAGLAFVCSALIMLAGCATSDLNSPDYSGDKAVLVLYPMATSGASTRCMIAAIDGIDVRDRQSWRLTAEYLIPAGQHSYKVVCEDSIGSIAVRDYSFKLELLVSADGEYGLMQQQREKMICILVQDLASNGKPAAVLVEHCLH
jgi:hypothetical protein